MEIVIITIEKFTTSFLTHIIIDFETTKLAFSWIDILNPNHFVLLVLIFTKNTGKIKKNQPKVRNSSIR